MSSGVRVGALEGLQRSVLMLRANWELVGLVWVQTVLTFALSVASLLPFVLVLDLEAPEFSSDPDASLEWLGTALATVEAQITSPAFWLAVLSSSVIMLAVLACYSFFQAGIFGVLTTADRQAPSGRVRDTTLFRTYSWAEYQGRGGRHLWRFFWLFQVILGLWCLWALVAMLAAVAVALVGGGAGLPAGMALGCAAVFPLGLLFVLLLFWAVFAEAAIAEEDCGIWQAMAESLRIMVRRLGALVLLFAVTAFATLALGMVFLVVSLPLTTGLLPFGGLERVATWFLQGLQWFFTGILQLVISGAVVVILRNERSLEADPGADGLD